MIKSWLQSIETEIRNTETDRHKQGIPQISRWILQEIKNGRKAALNFICTHNSRRSQFAQAWCRVVQDYLEMDVADSFSGGTEATACNPRTVAAFERAGLTAEKSGVENPVYLISAEDLNTGVKLWSKVYDDETNPKDQFAAIMTCDHADANCPFIPGASVRIPLTYTDPKYADDTDGEVQAYDDTCSIIATDMMRIFYAVKSQLD